MTDFKTTLNELFLRLQTTLQLNQIEIGPLGSPLTIGFYEKWLSENHFGSMTYLKNHLAIKKNPQLLNAHLKSVISVSQSYFPSVQPLKEKSVARTALYAQNEDYHYWLKEKLNQLIQQLQILYPNEIFLPFVDSGPVLERNWGYQNSLGWFGKNTCLIHPQHGSLFFIAEILTSLEVSSAIDWEPLPDFCGKCQKCIEVCPTEALVKPREMKADLCISYLTIESKTTPPLKLREKMGDWFFGCDLCQTVCPWNEKVFRQKKISPSHQTSPSLQLNLKTEEKKELIDYFRWLLGASNNQIQKKYAGTPYSRAGGKGLKRNALIVIANRHLHELTNEVTALKIEELNELKAWTLSKLSPFA